jgi:hypothetical protein
MEKYYFLVDVYETNYPSALNKYVGKKQIIKYKCIICGYEHEWDETWSDEKKAEVKAEVDAHHNQHIIPVTSSDNTETPTSNS